MSYTNELKFFWNVVCNPDKYAKRKLDIGSALKLYYTLAVLPFLAYVVIGMIAVSLGVNVHGFGSNSMMSSLSPFLAALSNWAIIIGAIATFFIAIPLGIAISTLIYQIIGKMFLGVWKGTYEKTFSALMFAQFPVLMLMWLGSIPFLNSFFIILAPLWGMVVFVSALSAQQGITKLNAFLMMLVKSVVVAIVLILLGLSLLTSLAYVMGNLMPAGGMTGPIASNATIGNWIAAHWGD